MQFSLPANLDATTAIYIGIGFTVCVVLALIGWSRRRRRPSGAQSTNENLLEAIIERQSPGSERQRPLRRGPDTRQPAAGVPQLSLLEGRLRTAILDAKARERLVKDTMATCNDRSAAVRKVLHDLEAEDKRWSS